MKRMMAMLAISVTLLFAACATEKEAPFPSEDEKPQKEAPLSAPLVVNDLKPGAGNTAEEGDTVLVHYTGWLFENGRRTTQFDTSRAPNREAFEVTIGVTQVIRGWTEGLVGMKMGGVRQLIIPPELAYGPRGRPPVIPPSSTLEFEIELVGILKK